MPEALLDQRSSTFRDYLVVVRRRKWLILAVVGLIPLLAVVLSLRETPLYAASATVLVSRENPAAALIGTSQSSLLADRDAETEASLARVPEVAQQTLAAAHVRDMTVDDFLHASSASPSVNSDLLTFEVVLPDGRRAITLATAYADAYTRYRRQLDTDSLKQARTAIEQRLAQLETGAGAPGASTGAQLPRLDEVARSALFTNLVEKDEQLRAAEALSLSKFVVVRTADHADKVRPRTVRNGLLGLALGVFVALGLAFFKETLDTRPRSGVEMGAELELPLLARIPTVSRLHKNNRLVMLSDPHGAGAEAFRVLRANLDLLDRRGGGSRRSVMVTSAGDGEGKTTTVANLAIALAQAGRHVILVDLDLRRPALGRLFGIQGRPGLVDLALGHVECETALVHIPLRNPGGNGSKPNGNANAAALHGRLELLLAGAISVEPGDFVGSDALADTLAELRRRADIVLVDAPPVLGVGDALVLSGKVDELIVVSRLGRLERPTINELRTVLRACRARKLGVVLTGVDPRQMYGDPIPPRAEAANGKARVQPVSAS